MKEASYYQKELNKHVLCSLCPQYCIIADGKKGFCKARINQGGKLYSENYGQISAVSFDPIEKKPLYHFYPGEEILSIGSFGCNLSCSFCQNWQISQQKPKLRELSVARLIELAIEENSIGIAYTYSEPSICFEYLLEVFSAAHQRGLKNVMITNGYINQEPLQELIPYLDALNIDLKAYTNDFYKNICKGSLKPVLDNITLLYEKRIHIEITSLIITDHNDSLDELEKLFKWLSNLSANIPLHLSRYFPNYKMEKIATDVNRIREAYSLAKNYLNYVYPGNIELGDSRSTSCPQCGEDLIIRKGYIIKDLSNKGKCESCAYQLVGRF